MPLTDLSLAACREYAPDLAVPADFDAFWARTLASDGAAPRLREVRTGLTRIRTFDVTVDGFGGEPVSGWLQVPAGVGGPLGCVVEYLGYSRGRGLAQEHLFWASAGYAHLVMDSRGQGWNTAPSTTPDPDGAVASAQPGVITRGLDDPDRFYYRRLYTDAVRFAQAARALPDVDPDRVAVAGGSQGGGLTLAVSGLVSGLAAAMPDVPFLCDFRRGVDVASSGPYTEIAAHLALHRDAAARAFATLAYFDGVTLAARATAPALFSIAMMDPICPPSTCFAAYNAYGGPKDVRVYEFNGHEGGGLRHRVTQLEWLRERLSP